VKNTPTALLVDDHQIFLDGLVLVMGHDARIRVVGRADSSAGAIEAAARLQPDLVVLDVDLGSVPAETTLRGVLRASPRSRVAMLTMHNSTVLRDSLMRSGAAAFLSKTLAAASVIDKLLAASTQPQPTAPPSDQERPLLTRREREVLRLMSLAMSNSQIARELSISEGTVKRHASTAYLKLGATSRVDAARKAAMLGLI
jgi:DNA-binding NarL/FixJ family response regulator